MAPRRYRVIGEYITVKTITFDGPQVIGKYRGAYLPPDVPEEIIEHLLSVRLIEDVTPSPAAPVGVVEDGGDDVSAGSQAPVETAADGDLEQRRADARAKLQAAGGTPTRRHGQQVWAEYAVIRGYGRAQAEAATKDELIELTGSA